MSRELLFANAPERLLSNSSAVDPNEHQLRPEALEQVGKHWLDSPHRYTGECELLVGGRPVVANPASRFGVKRGEELRAAGDPKRSSTNDATFIATPHKSTIVGSHSPHVLPVLSKGR